MMERINEVCIKIFDKIGLGLGIISAIGLLMYGAIYVVVFALFVISNIG